MDNDKLVLLLTDIKKLITEVPQAITDEFSGHEDWLEYRKDGLEIVNRIDEAAKELTKKENERAD